MGRCPAHACFLLQALILFIVFFLYSNSEWVLEQRKITHYPAPRCVIMKNLAPTSLSPEMALIWETPLFVLGTCLHNILVKDVTSNPTHHTNRKSELNTAKPKQKNSHFACCMLTFLALFPIFQYWNKLLPFFILCPFQSEFWVKGN